jgi:hypothetical protein
MQGTTRAPEWGAERVDIDQRGHITDGRYPRFGGLCENAGIAWRAVTEARAFASHSKE